MYKLCKIFEIIYWFLYIITLYLDTDMCEKAPMKSNITKIDYIYILFQE